MSEEAKSLHDELAAAFESVEEDAGVQVGGQEPEREPEREPEVSESDQDLGSEKSPGNADVTEEMDKAGSEEGEQEGPAAPEHWSAADKEAFAKSPREVQEWALRRDKEMTADYTRKTQEIANLRKTWEPLNEMFAPHIARGVQVAPLIQSWAQVAQHLDQNPAQALQQLARQYNVDLGQLTPRKSDDIWGEENRNVVDPKVSQLEQQIQQLTGHLQQRDQIEQQAKTNAFVSDIEAFAQKKTEAGEPAHPHFDELIPDMMMMARALKAQGQQPNLQDLYDKALWANPSTREKTIAAQQQAAAKKAEEEAIAKAKKARQASKSVGGNASTSMRPDMSLREMIESQF